MRLGSSPEPTHTASPFCFLTCLFSTKCAACSSANSEVHEVTSKLLCNWCIEKVLLLTNLLESAGAGLAFPLVALCFLLRTSH